MNVTRFLAAATLSLVTLSGCAATSQDSSTDGGWFSYGETPTTGAATDGGSESSYGPDRSVITTASVFLTGDDPAAVADAVANRARAEGGKIDGRSASSDDEGNVTWISLTVRVPSDVIDSFLTDLNGIATVHNLQQNSTDVTLVVTDYAARIAALESSIARFLVLEKAAKTTQDLIDIETALADRQAQLEQLQSEMRYYSDQIALSTVQIEIGLPDSATDPIPDDFWGGVVAGWNALVAFFGGTLIAFGVSIPWLPVVAALGWIGWRIGRTIMTRRSTRSTTGAARPTKRVKR